MQELKALSPNVATTSVRPKFKWGAIGIAATMIFLLGGLFAFFFNSSNDAPTTTIQATQESPLDNLELAPSGATDTGTGTEADTGTDTDTQRSVEPSEPPAKQVTKTKKAKDTGILRIFKSRKERRRVRIFIDGERHGNAPKDIRLSPGLHEVVFSAGNRKSTIKVSIKAGKTKKISAKVPR